MTSLRSGTLTVAGLFLSAAIIAAVLALALWDFKAHQTQTNLFYGGYSFTFLSFPLSSSLSQ
ncbi:unnamed protein product [Anisakis simplex]|uniref:Transmembrane protein n=1 Tax=Anisakis simplex TaxID=6269 RepID=A0A0M3KFE3_ANISI|nr:unnamed protein product [Anisakis simplex]